ncbi:MAG TPA: translation initiation factor IF-2 [Bacteroidetes bacterium]|nr:translation initiation factor IF-2 [Bacteroidota bacterium]
MSKRLVKVAKELNVGTSTIVDFLKENGFEIDSRPTSKVTEEMENLLHEKYSKSIAIKEQADSLLIGIRPSPKKEPAPEPEPVSILSPPPPPPVVEPVAVPEKPPVIEEPPVAEEPPVTEEPPKKEPRVGLKIKGKINLDKKGRPVKEKVKEVKPEPIPVVPEPVSEKPKSEIPAEAPPVEVPAAKEETQPGEAKVSEDKKESGSPAPSDDSPADKSEEDAAKKPGDNMVRAVTPELRGLKILGKIDIQKKKKEARPKKKKKEEPQKGRAKSGDKGGQQESKPNAASGSSEGRRRRRTRRKVTVSEGRNANQNQSQGRRGGGGRRGGTREVSKKEVDDQIKKTMASLSGAGKKKRQKMRRGARERLREKQELMEMEGEITKLQVTEFVTVQELANMMDVTAAEVITTCMSLGVFVSINQRLDAELIELVASEYDHEVEFISVEDQTDADLEEEDAPEDMKPRAPIITVMGHVDHGKTSLLDYIRKTKVADDEAGGITQHIGAYEVEIDGKKMTFLDTPGHEAFTAMRARGTKVTDIAIIVVAADDNVMPQTKEAISHAQAADVPMVFAINKIDKEGASPDRIKQELSGMNILVEEWGGQYQSQDISAKTGEGIPELLEKVLLVTEMAELKANPNRPAQGTVLEASLDKGKGYVTSVLVQRGTLKIGDAVVAGEYSGKVKAMFNELGARVKEVGPSAPVAVLGLSGAPQAGERFKVMESETEARQLASKRARINREQTHRATKRISLDEIGRRLALGTFKELNLIVKGDVDGSVEALSDSLIKLSLETVQVNVIHRAVGQIAESDVLLASASDAIIIGFQVRPSLNARKLAEREGVEIKLYSIIYQVIEDIKLAIEGLLEPTREEKIICNIEVREVYKISKVGTVAGCIVRDGKINRNTKVRIIRDGIVVYPTKEGAVAELGSLKRYKDDVKEVSKGMECGLTIKKYNDLKEGDIVEGYEVVEIKQKYGK